MANASNTLLTNDIISKEALSVLRNQFVLASRVTKSYESKFGGNNKAGDTIRIRKPVRYTSALGAAVNKNDSTESHTNITLAQRNIGMGFLSADRTLSIDDFSERFIKTAMAQLASDIDSDGFALYYKSENVTTPGVYTGGKPAVATGADISTLRPFNDAKARMVEKSAPVDDQLYVAVSPACSAGLVDGLKGLFQSSSEIAAQYERGIMGKAAGFTFVESQVLPTHVSGTRTTGAVNGAAQSGASLAIDGVGATATVTQGDTFTIAGVFAINPLTRQATNKLQIYSVQASEVAVGGEVTLSIAPSINVTAPNQTVSAAPADGAVVTWTTGASVATDVQYCWHRDSMTVAFVDLTTDLPGAESSKATDEESGITVRLTGQYDANSDETVYRLDVMYGWQVLRGEHTCLILG